MRFWLDVEDEAGVRQGASIINASNWRHEDLLDKAGKVSFELPAADPRNSQLTARRRVRCKTVVDGAVADMGVMILHRRSKRREGGRANALALRRL